MTDPDSRLRSWRVAFSVLVFAFLGVAGAMGGLGAKCEVEFRWVALPMLTVLCLRLAGFVRSFPGFIVLTVWAAALLALTWRGTLDRRLKLWAALLGLTTLLVAAFIGFGLYLPFLSFSPAIR